MPLYEYKCGKCGKIKELIQKFTDVPLKICNHCSGKMIKLISNSTFHLKGTGWYTTDYGTNNVNNTNKSTNSETSSNTVGGKIADKSASKHN